MLSRLLCVLHFCAIKVSRSSSIVKRNASMIICRSSHRWSSIKKVLLKIMENSLENSSARVSFLKNFAGLKPATLFKKRLWHSCFPASFAKFLRTDFKLIISIRLKIYLLIFVKNHIWTSASLVIFIFKRYVCIVEFYKFESEAEIQVAHIYVITSW